MLTLVNITAQHNLNCEVWR